MSKMEPFFLNAFLNPENEIGHDSLTLLNRDSLCCLRESQLSAPQYPQMCSHAVHPSKIPKDENREDSNPDYSDSRDNRYVC